MWLLDEIWVWATNNLTYIVFGLSILWMVCVFVLLEVFAPRSTLVGDYLRVAQAWWTLHVSHNRVAREVQNFVPVPVYSDVGCQGLGLV